MCFLFSSCTVTRYVHQVDAYAEKYGGATYLDIVKAFGIPSRIEPDGSNGRFLIYEEKGAERSQTIYGADNQSSSTTSWTNSKYLQFHMNEIDICDSVLTNHTKPEEHFSIKETLKWTLVWTSPVWLLLGARVLIEIAKALE